MSETNKLQALEEENTKLQHLIQELEKRLKAVENSQTTQSQLIAIRDYFDELEAYLNALNNMYESHMLSFETYSTQIEALQQQINTINQTIESMPNWEEYNLTDINAKIENLTISLNDALDQLDHIQGGSDNNIYNISNDVATMQTEISYIQEDINSALEEINSVNTNVGNMQTTLTNLNSTQNSLTSAQNSLESTITGIDSRLTTAENNISALTGGIDVSGLDSRITALEQSPKITTIVAKNKYPMLLRVPANESFYSLYYYYKTDSADCVAQNFKLNYTSQGTGTLNISLLQNGEIVKEYAVNLEEHPSEYEIEFYYYTTDKYQNFQFLFKPTTDVQFNNLDATIIGANIQLFETDKELKAFCYNNYIYITRYVDNQVKFTRYSLDTFSLDPTTLDDEKDWYILDRARCVTYGPQVSSSVGKITHHSDCVVTECSMTNKMYNAPLNATDHSISSFYNSDAVYSSGVVTMTPHITGQISLIKNNVPAYKYATNSSTTIIEISNIQNYKTGNWHYCTVVQYNNYVVGSTTIQPEKILTLGVHEDGYLYLIVNQAAKSVTKIGKGGKFATGYLQEDGSVNIYINHYNSTDVYNVVIADDGTATPTFIETIANCDCVYEILGNKKIMHKNNEWVIEETVIEEETTTETETTE